MKPFNSVFQEVLQLFSRAKEMKENKKGNPL